LLVLAVAAGLAGCAALVDPKGTSDELLAVLPSERAVDRAMAALSRGDTAAAENWAVSALRKNRRDPYALLIAGLVYQNTGRYDLARQYYEVILTNQPQVTLMLPGDDGIVRARPLIDVARTNIAVIDKITGRSSPKTSLESGRAPGTEQTAQPVPDAEMNVAGRFRILKRLLDDHQVTPEEYSSRRSTNLGALLPYSASPPAAGLERPVPDDSQIITRLKDLKAAVEAREISPAQESVERGMILEKLLPARPANRMMPVLPPNDMIEAARMAGRLERLRAAGLISGDEFAREKAAMERALDARLAGKPVDVAATGLRYGTVPTTPAPEATPLAPSAWGVALATVKSEEEGKATWDRIRLRFPEDLLGKSLSLTKVTLRNKGVRWKVVAGPLDSKDSAVRLCKTLKLHRQSCDPAPFKG
jgi:hypothetical protein